MMKTTFKKTHKIPDLFGDIKYCSQAVLYQGQLRADYSLFSAAVLNKTGYLKDKITQTKSS